MNRYHLALLRTIVPDADENTLSHMEGMLTNRREEIRKKFTLFLKVIRILGFLKTGRAFERLAPEKRARLLRSFEYSRLSLFRRGFWGLRSLVMLAFYTDARNAKKIGFSGPTLKSPPAVGGRPLDPYNAYSNGNPGDTATPRVLEYDIIIIGSGAGGGQIAKRLIPLAKSGMSIAVLESGPHYETSYFNQQEKDMTRLFWEDGGFLNEEGSMTLAAGRMMGGSTPVYTGVTFELPEDVYRAWGCDEPYAAFRERMVRIKKELNAHILPPEEINLNNRLFKQGALAAGMNVLDLELVTRNCKGAGFCNIGCVNDAKMSTLNNQLPRAREAGIELIPNTHVEAVYEGGLRARIFPAPENTLAGKHPPGAVEFRAKKIVIAAGTPGTNVILSRSRSAGHLTKIPGSARGNVTMHPTLTVYGRRPESVEGYKSFPKSYYVDDFSHSENHFIETAYYYPGVSAKNIEGWGEEHRRRMDSYPDLMCAILLCHDEALERNKISWKSGRPFFDYKISDSTVRALLHSQRRAAAIFFEAGCDEVYLPFARDGIVRAKDRDRLEEAINLNFYIPNRTVFASAHPQGGCAMGADPATSVCDFNGKIRGYNGLYIADASLFPSSSHVNPFLSVMALADRVAAGILAEES